MGRNNYFQFKHFSIIQENAAFKVGTDAVLLGSWVNISTAKTILDIGTGTGIIALMMAQRSTARITGIEIEKNAAEEATGNVKNSPWNQRVNILNTSFQDFVKANTGVFDLIVSNPPFFTNSQKSKCNLLALARHNDLLPHARLVIGAVELLERKGRLAVILPAETSPGFIEMAENNGLHLIRQTDVKPNNRKKTNRFLMEFGKIKEITEKSSLIIYDDEKPDFTDDYKWLTRDFYLNF
ncbi:MAG: methyltransferase [Mariniphaga sp.]|nr:methyltransferase [Mariniphaga sp.]